MVALGLESYRFSIAWPRVQPDGRGALNARGVAFYRRLVEGLLERGIEPVATLYHWDLPSARQAAGGWAVRDTAERFAEYAALMADRLGDVVTQWITHNEPWVVAFLGHAEGVKAPGIRDWVTALRVSHHLLLSHGLAARALRGAEGRRARRDHAQPRAGARGVGVRGRRRGGGAAGRAPQPLVPRPGAARRVPARHGRAVRALLRAARRRPRRRPRRHRRARSTSSASTTTCPSACATIRGAPRSASPRPARGPPLTAMGWEVDADGLHALLLRLRRDYGDIPVYITENGAAFDGERGRRRRASRTRERVAYLRDHLAALERAVADGVDVRRYYAWSLLDNFEWEHGYSKRFGIVHVDYETQRRTPKRSALWYRDYIAAQRIGSASSP